MSRHFSQMIYWDGYFTSLKRFTENEGIAFPIHSCGNVHQSQTTERILQNNHKKKLLCKYCTCSSDPTPYKKYFYPNLKETDGYRPILNCFYGKGYQSFLKSIHDTLLSLGRDYLNQMPVCDYEKALNQVNDIKASIVYTEYYGDCDIVRVLLERERLDCLFALDGRYFDLKEVTSLSAPCGGQAVGNFWKYLCEHLFRSYLEVNVWLYNVENGLYFEEFDDRSRGYRSYRDCDARAYLSSCREYLQPEVYLKNVAKMHELVRKLFRFLALFSVVLIETDRHDSVFHLVDMSIGSTCW